MNNQKFKLYHGGRRTRQYHLSKLLNDSIVSACEFNEDIPNFRGTKSWAILPLFSELAGAARGLTQAFERFADLAWQIKGYPPGECYRREKNRLAAKWIGSPRESYLSESIRININKTDFEQRFLFIN